MILNRNNEKYGPIGRNLAQPAKAWAMGGRIGINPATWTNA